MDTSLDFRIVRVMEKVRSDPSQNLPELARMVNLSKSRLSHLFKAETGINLTSFIEERRMERAASLLRSTDMRVKEISFTLGFQHEASFDRAFSKKFQCTPTSYRKQRRVTVPTAEG